MTARGWSIKVSCDSGRRSADASDRPSRPRRSSDDRARSFREGRRDELGEGSERGVRATSQERIDRSDESCDRIRGGSTMIGNETSMQSDTLPSPEVTRRSSSMLAVWPVLTGCCA